MKDTKLCPICGKVLFKSEFYVRRGGGAAAFCKTCDIENSKKRRSKSPESRIKVLFLTAKSRCKKENLEFNITEAEIIALFYKQSGLCFYTKELMTFAGGNDCISIDRLDANIGYVLPNLVLCKWVVNNMKNNLSLPDFISICRKIYENNS